MRVLLTLIVFVFSGVYAFSATGDKPNQMNLPFRNVSSSSKPSGCVIGELRRNDHYIFVCASSSKWRRISLGSGF